MANVETRSVIIGAAGGAIVTLTLIAIFMGIASPSDSTPVQPVGRAPEQFQAKTSPSPTAERTDSLEDLTAAANRAQKWQQGAKTDPDAMIQPAPVGLPVRVADAAIKEAGHTCGKVVSALRLPDDGSILARCEGGERYRVFSVKGQGAVAMNCEAAERLGVEGC